MRNAATCGWSDATGATPGCSSTPKGWGRAPPCPRRKRCGANARGSADRRDWSTIAGRPTEVSSPSRSTASTMPAPSKPRRSEEHTSELQSLMRNSYAVFCLKKKKLVYTQTDKYHQLYCSEYDVVITICWLTDTT